MSQPFALNLPDHICFKLPVLLYKSRLSNPVVLVVPKTQLRVNMMLSGVQPEHDHDDHDRIRAPATHQVRTQQSQYNHSHTWIRGAVFLT